VEEEEVAKAVIFLLPSYTLWLRHGMNDNWNALAVEIIYLEISKTLINLHPISAIKRQLFLF